MSVRTRSTLNAQVSEEAAEWFIDFRSGDVDAAGRRAFEAWVRSSPEHLRAYLEHAALWTESDAIDAGRGIDIEALIARARDEGAVIRFERVRSGGKKPWYGSQRMAAAATVLILLAASIFGYLVVLSRQPVYSTEAGEQRSIRLPDGSTVELNSRSRLQIRFKGGGERRVDLLEGQALFDIAKDPTRPFIVRSDDTRVRAVGTRFDVNRKHSGTIVTVIEGKVAVTHMARFPRNVIKTDLQENEPPGRAAPIYLSAGEQLASSTGKATAPTRADVAIATAWMQRQLVLKSAPLTEVAEEFNRYSDRKLVVEDKGAEQLRLSGVFATDPDFFIRYLRARPDIAIEESEDVVRIVRRDRD